MEGDNSRRQGTLDAGGKRKKQKKDGARRTNYQINTLVG